MALVVNVTGFGLVLISGCGHPRIEQILGVTEQVLDVPIKAVVGGLHLPVHPAGPRWCRRRSWATRTLPGSRSANATPGTCWRRSPPAARSWSPCPATTAHPGPTAPSAAGSATATAPCEPGKNCASPPPAPNRPGALPVATELLDGARRHRGNVRRSWVDGPAGRSGAGQLPEGQVDGDGTVVGPGNRDGYLPGLRSRTGPNAISPHKDEGRAINPEGPAG